MSNLLEQLQTWLIGVTAHLFPKVQLNHLLALLDSQPFPNPTALSSSHITSTVLYTMPSNI